MPSHVIRKTLGPRDVEKNPYAMIYLPAVDVDSKIIPFLPTSLVHKLCVQNQLLDVVLTNVANSMAYNIKIAKVSTHCNGYVLARTGHLVTENSCRQGDLVTFLYNKVDAEDKIHIFFAQAS
ncbi:hypothetical protein CTI12_AA632150 [Artemisia annua]|uniref:Uncharacterized protein n=1 Tax=Artemisia annua TaxID=35608 RepID=A0A2U1K8F2_ARTAN|nr:hypothetical protein CTI12_AA632150 [Artemisia annua]